MSMMGGTALLEELLAEQAAKSAPQDLNAKPQDCSGAAAVSSRGSTASSISRLAAIAPAPPAAQHIGAPKVPHLDAMHKVHAAEYRCQDEYVLPPASPLSRQIAELAQEMDDCLGSLDDWEEDKRRHREKLLHELEAQYGAEYGFDNAAEDLDDSFGRAPVEAAHHRADQVRRAPHFTSADVVYSASADEVLARLQEEDEVARFADEARISQLRAEVEELRMRAGDSCDLSSLAVPEASLHMGGRHQVPGTPHPGLVLDASLSGMDSTLGLQAWREEVDAVLGEQSFEEELHRGSPDGTSPTGLAVMEGQLAGARARVRLLEDAVDSANACAEDELGKLDQLLSECEELQARFMNGNVAEGGEPSQQDFSGHLR